MPLHPIKDFEPDYRSHFDNQDILKFDLYSGKEKIGSIENLLVDDEGHFRYLVVSTGAWIFGKKVLLPIGLSHIDSSNRRVYVDGLTREQVERLPEYSDRYIDYDQEEQVRDVYRPMTRTEQTATAPAATYNRDTYRYENEPALYGMNDREHQNLKLYEERLIANKNRQKTGEVIVGKRVETETQTVSVPIEKERVVIERTTPTDAGTPVAPGEASFAEGEVARMEVYEETPDIQKEAFVREQVDVRKEVDRDTVELEDQVRREELDVNSEGRSVVENPDRRPNQQI